ncbi:MAG TPA: YkgJ family cysteine cluster protein [Terracidiphilus sp.]|nr:YkgJ family cysteine cluster protein [Terracidiphilus sp.]
MSGISEPQAPGFGTVEFALKVQSATLQVRAQLPEGPVRPGVLLPILQRLSNSMTDLAVLAANQLGEQLSCREGCGACCRQAVPISPVEARAIAEWLGEQPEERRAALLERFRRAAARLEESGIAQAARETGPETTRDGMHELGLRYFTLGIPCPFLEDERCTIHEIRPLRCREYLVVSSAEHCAHPQTKQIVGIKPPVLLSKVLEQWDTNGDRRPRALILLTMLEEWVAKHPAVEDRPHRTSPELLQEFLHAFAKDAETAPSDPRGSMDAW